MCYVWVVGEEFCGGTTPDKEWGGEGGGEFLVELGRYFAHVYVLQRPEVHCSISITPFACRKKLHISIPVVLVVSYHVVIQYR